MATAQRRKRPVAQQARSTPERKEYLNTTQGWLGARQINHRNGDVESVAIPPGGRVFLTEEEVELTAQSHQRAEDSPFVPREITYFDPSTQDPMTTALLSPLEPAETFARSGGKTLPTEATRQA